MTGKERFERILKHQPVDRIGLYEHFWNDTYKTWQEQGHIPEGASYEDLFGFDVQESWCFNLTADLDFEPKIISEDEDTYTALDGNGATLRRHKFHDTTPEHIDFSVKEREDWERLIKPFLTPDPRRINFEAYRKAKAEAAEKISQIALDIQNEANIETLVKAKGFEECVAVISEDSVSVVVSAQSLQATEVAQIMSIVYETTGIGPEKVSVVQK